MEPSATAAAASSLAASTVGASMPALPPVGCGGGGGVGCVKPKTSNELYKLKLISISLLWMDIGHVMCSWTH